MPHYTPMQQRILAILSDGMPHSRKEIRTLLGDELMELQGINQHVMLLRKKLRPIGEDIVCELGKHYKLGFRHVRLLASAVDGKS